MVKFKKESKEESKKESEKEFKKDGMMRAITIHEYGVFDEDGNVKFRFVVYDPDEREDVNIFFDQEVNIKEDLIPVLEDLKSAKIVRVR